jgi:energy-coupling factor transport system permease protein
MRFLLPILASVLAIYALVYQSYEGIISGLGIGLRVFMIFIPLEVLLKTSTIGEILFSFRKLMPYRYLFMLTIAVRFVPYFSKELEEIIAIQRMRGVELCLKTFISREGINALLIPLTIRGIRAADEITISAVSRGFGIHNRRSSIHE